MNKWSISIILAVFLILSQSNAATFQGIGDFPGESGLLSVPAGVSPDGSVVFGRAESHYGWESFRWTAETGIQRLGFPWWEGYFGSGALDASYDGSIIIGAHWIGDSDGYTMFRPYVWTQADGTRELPMPAGLYGDWSGEAVALSSDGRLAVGWIGRQPPVHGQRRDLSAVVWNIEDRTVELMEQPPSTDSSYSSRDISSNGSTILVGTLQGDYLWTEQYGYTQTTFPGGEALSPDGKVIAGTQREYTPTFHEYGFLLNGNDEITMLGVPDGWVSNPVYAISYDGSVVVGKLCDGYFNPQYGAYLWTEQEGVRLLEEILVEDYGLDLTGWDLLSATGISYDGMTIVGTGINPDGYLEGWVATIPEPATIILLGIGALAIRRRKMA